jgi:hypothetical protein
VIHRYVVFAASAWAVLSSGCASGPPEAERGVIPDPAFVRANSTVDRVADTGVAWVMTPPYFPNGRFSEQVSLLAKHFPDGRLRFEVYLFTKRVEWAQFETAYGPEGERLEIEFYGRSVGSPGAYEERLGAVVNRSLLEGGLEAGLEFVFVGRGGQQPVALPAFMIQGFLEKVDLLYPGDKTKPEKEG